MREIFMTVGSRQPPWFNGLELLEDAKQNKHVLPSGCEGIDILLEGGFRIGQLTEIVGPSSSGKTQMCLRSALGVADMNLGSVFFLDTCNSFSSNRIASMINQHTATSVEEDGETRVKRIMSRILCQSVYDIFELLDILRQLENRLSYQEKSNGNSIRLLIIDSIATLVAPILGSKNSQGRMLTISTGILLKRIANDYNLSVLRKGNEVLVSYKSLDNVVGQGGIGDEDKGWVIGALVEDMEQMPGDLAAAEML
ncbi:hypothetical protein ZIOFF_016179 [Zingiber officinale]|uniref:RecA family profile 1 domain-containing protein n=1 Tax=Zingiber officinale TaxID=94328 RepID=A0A8J5LUV4_ZINOF|nr:hypothetical protein ZIOFF_016179 [Zingiber officinale]